MYWFSLRRVLKRAFKYVPFALLLLFVLLMAVSITFRWQAQRALDAKVQELREAGVPTTADELGALYRPAPDVPDVGTAFAAIHEIIEAYKCNELSEEQETFLPIMGAARTCAHTPLPPENLQQLKVTLSALATPLVQAEKLLESRPVIFRVSGDIDRYSDVRATARLMAMASLLAAEEHDANEAGIAWLRGWRVGEVLRAEPGLAPAAARCAADRLILEIMPLIFNRVAVPVEHLRLWQTALLHEELKSTMTRIIHGDIVEEIIHSKQPGLAFGEFVYMIEEYDDPYLILNSFFHSYYYLAFASKERATKATLDILNSVLSLGDMPNDKIAKRLNEILNGELRDTVDAGTLLPGTISNLEHASTYLIGRDYPMRLLAALACGVELYIAEHGAPPESLDALTEAHVPQAIIDPNSGKAFLYERTPQGYVLRSEAAKECGKFDAEEDEDCYNECTLHDLVLEVRRPELAVASAG